MGQTFDTYISEKWFVRDGLNMQSEAIAQLEALISGDRSRWFEEGAASENARLDYVRERLRLLYVGITRAKQELIITWNTGRRGDLAAALPLVALHVFAQEHGYGGS